MTHDSRCEGPQGDAHTRWICRCEIRALEARLAEAQSAVTVNYTRWEEMKARAERAEALLAEWRPVVRAAVALDGESTNDDTKLRIERSEDEGRAAIEMRRAVAALSPAAREAATEVHMRATSTGGKTKPKGCGECVGGLADGVNNDPDQPVFCDCPLGRAAREAAR